MQFGHLEKMNPVQAESLDKWGKAVTISQAEMMRLASRRAKAYMDLPRTMATCRSPHDIIVQQQAFWQQCAQDYVNASQVMASNWTQFFPFAHAITGLNDTINDESLNSAPDAKRDRDVMAVQSANKRSAKPARGEADTDKSDQSSGGDNSRAAA